MVPVASYRTWLPERGPPRGGRTPRPPPRPINVSRRLRPRCVLRTAPATAGKREAQPGAEHEDRVGRWGAGSAGWRPVVTTAAFRPRPGGARAAHLGTARSATRAPTGAEEGSVGRPGVGRVGRSPMLLPALLGVSLFTCKTHLRNTNRHRRKRKRAGLGSGCPYASPRGRAHDGELEPPTFCGHR